MKAINYSLALKLKHIGFSELVMDYYYKGTLNGGELPNGACLGHSLYEDFNDPNDGKDYCSAPALEDVGEWLRTNYKLWVYVRPSFCDGTEYAPNLVNEDGDEYFCDSEFFSDYNDAYERAIEVALDLLEQAESDCGDDDNDAESGLTLEKLYQLVSKMYEKKENRKKKVRVWFWSKKNQIGACSFDKLGKITDAANYFDSRAEKTTSPIIKVDEI